MEDESRRREIWAYEPSRDGGISPAARIRPIFSTSSSSSSFPTPNVILTEEFGYAKKAAAAAEAAGSEFVAAMNEQVRESSELIEPESEEEESYLALQEWDPDQWKKYPVTKPGNQYWGCKIFIKLLIILENQCTRCEKLFNI
ncbi:OLC1v1003109C1 [Oldenlandia corymbosa var. corymbosa]|uniref:OLC1v1003109C1 n=1 Tax=Oldenlandia corymbosa var. corymbosa TaxID=529605 RepID=A0AAV1D9A0_OLDCO|nr:OLC1v1003109C1 [Oldenlandia corymbosa var. corymbosa]